MNGKTRDERQLELQELAKTDAGRSKIRDMASKARGQQEGAIPQEEVGSLVSDDIRTIVEHEHPEGTR